jgi:hypothetical protein
MTLRELIAKLEALDPAERLTPGFGAGHSWRGAYEQVAFAPVESATAAEMLAHARKAVGSTLLGWKGGEYDCTLDTECNVAGHGEYGGDSDRMGIWWASNVEASRLRARISALTVDLDETRAALRAQNDLALERLARANAAESALAASRAREEGLRRTLLTLETRFGDYALIGSPQSGAYLRCADDLHRALALVPADAPPGTVLTFDDALRIARGCTDYGGGHRGDAKEFETYQHGIQTVINALTAAAKDGLKDTQIRVLHAIGAPPTDAPPIRAPIAWENQTPDPDAYRQGQQWKGRCVCGASWSRVGQIERERIEYAHATVCPRAAPPKEPQPEEKP